MIEVPTDPPRPGWTDTIHIVEFRDGRRLESLVRAEPFDERVSHRAGKPGNDTKGASPPWMDLLVEGREPESRCDLSGVIEVRVL